MTAGRPRARLHVTFLIGSLAVGGAERQLVHLVNHLDRRRFRPAVITWSRGGALGAALAHDVTLVELDPHCLGLGPLERPLLALRITAGVARALRRLDSDLLVGYMFAGYVLGAFAARLARVPTVIAARRGLDTFNGFGRAAGIAGRLANQRIALHLCNSEAARRRVLAEEGVPPDRVAVVHNGIEPLASAPPDPLVTAAREGAEAVAAMVANLIPYKRHDVLLEALARLRDRHPAFRVVLFGDGPERARLESEVARRDLGGMVVFAGSRADAVSLLPQFDLAVLASDTESFPNALMEAMAQGIPVVATRVGGVPELVEDGVHGILVPAGDAAALASALEAMLAAPDRRREMGAAARGHVLDGFTMERMVTATEAVLERVAAGRHAPAAAPVEAA